MMQSGVIKWGEEPRHSSTQQDTECTETPGRQVVTLLLRKSEADWISCTKRKTLFTVRQTIITVYFALSCVTFSTHFSDDGDGEDWWWWYSIFNPCKTNKKCMFMWCKTNETKMNQTWSIPTYNEVHRPSKFKLLYYNNPVAQACTSFYNGIRDCVRKCKKTQSASYK